MTKTPLSVKGVLIHDDRVLLLRNERGEWDLPGGRPDPGEDFRVALKREVQEETGLEVEVGAALDEYLFEVLPQKLPGHFVRTVPQMGWATIQNGRLLRLAEKEFDVFFHVAPMADRRRLAVPPEF